MCPAGRTGLVLRASGLLRRPAGAGRSSGFFLLAGRGPAVGGCGSGRDRRGGSEPRLRRTELVRILSVHPRARVSFTTGTGRATLPTKRGSSARRTRISSPCPRISATYAAPSGPPILRGRGDLSGDLRLPTAASIANGTARPPGAGAPGQAPYGLTELYRTRSAPRASSAIRLLRDLRAPPADPLVRESSSIPTTWSSTPRAGRPEPAAAREDLIFSEVADDFSA